MPKKPLQERILEADTRASQWLADANEAREAGNLSRAEACEAKAQFWKDRYNLLAGKSDRPAPRK